jgi:hypothetical protein
MLIVEKRSSAPQPHVAVPTAIKASSAKYDRIEYAQWVESRPNSLMS